MSSKSIRISVTGASGLIGRELLKDIPEDWYIHALSRGSKREGTPNLEWRNVDLFSLHSSTDALADTDVAIYLVHSMLPSTRLFQGSFSDADLLIADNFAHACVKNGVKQIIYLGGLMPKGAVSKHLRSRHEVEKVMRSTGIPCTILRAGMIAGQGGSSFEILRNLVRNLPAMLLPQWTRNKTQVIYIDDIVRVIKAAVMNRDYFDRVLDVVNGEAVTYENLIRATARSLKKRPFFLPVPVNSTAFSKLWVSIFGQTDYELASPLIDSLTCELPQGPPDALIADKIRFKSFDAMLTEIAGKPASSEARTRTPHRFENSVRSIQRLPALPTMGTAEIARNYERWLPVKMKGLIRVVSSERKGFYHVLFYFVALPWPLLILRTIPEDELHRNRIKFHIVGGILSKRKDSGWLEFRQVAGREFTLASINEFVPTLPWYLYRFSQAVVHKSVMAAFARSLEKSRLTYPADSSVTYPVKG